MSVDIKTLLESYNNYHDINYQKESERKAREGLDDTTRFSKEDTEEYISGDADDLSRYDTKTGKHIEKGHIYNKPIEEFNSLIVQPHLSEHQKARILTNLVRHNALIDARGGGEPHEYATDIQERALFNEYKSDKGILPKFEDLHTTIENDNKHYNSLSK